MRASLRRIWIIPASFLVMAAAQEIDSEIIKNLEFFQVMDVVEAADFKEMQQMMAELPEGVADKMIEQGDKELPQNESGDGDDDE